MIKLLLGCSLPCSATHNNVDDDGGTDEGRDGIEGNDACLAGKYADDAAKEGDEGSHENCHGEKLAMVLGADNHAGDVGYGESDEGNGSAEGGGNSGEDAGD